MARRGKSRIARGLLKMFSSHLLIQILPLLLMLKVGDELLDGIYHLSLGETFACSDTLSNKSLSIIIYPTPHTPSDYS